MCAGPDSEQCLSAGDPGDGAQAVFRRCPNPPDYADCGRSVSGTPAGHSAALEFRNGAARVEIRAPVSHREPPHRQGRHRVGGYKPSPSARGFRVHSLHRVLAQRCRPRDVRGDDRNTTGSACLTRYGERWECTSTPPSREFAPGRPVPCGKAIVASFRRSLSNKRCGHRHRPRRSRPERDVPVYREEREGAAGARPRWRMMRVPWPWPEPWCSRHWYRAPDSRSRSSRRSCRPSSAVSDRFSASGLSTSSFAGEWRHLGADELPCRSALPERPDSRTGSVIIHS